MLDKKVTYGKDAREKIKKGVDVLANAVKITLGPQGRNVILQRSYGSPVVTKDGVSVAKDIHLADPLENLGVILAKEVSAKTAEQAGDGTTTSAILIQAMVEEGMRHINNGAKPQRMRRGMEKTLSHLNELLKAKASPVVSDDQIRQIASISSNDEELGLVIADAVKAVGKNGVVVAEESQIPGVTLEVTKGMRFDKGYVSPYLITDEKTREAVYEKPLILVTDEKIEAGVQLKDAAVAASEAGNRPLIVIADEIRGEALATIIRNKLLGSFSILPIKAPAFGERRREILEDIATLTGAKFISTEKGMKLDGIKVSDLGTCEKIVSTDAHTTITGGKGEEKLINDRIKFIEKQVSEAKTEYDKEKFRERIARLSGGVASIKVGGSTEAEMIEKKHRIEDAIAATRAAVEEGIVPGGGTIQMLLSREALADLKWTDGFDGGMQIGAEVVLNSLRAPFRTIVENAGRLEDFGVLLLSISDTKGWDANKEEFTNMLEAGIIDPAKVTRCSLENAVSAAIMILTTEAAVTDVQKPYAVEDKGAEETA